MSIEDAVVRLEALGVHRHDIRIRRTDTTDYEPDGAHEAPRARWAVDVMSASVRHQITESAESLDQIVARLELRLGT